MILCPHPFGNQNLINHVTSSDQGLSSASSHRGKSLGTRLVYTVPDPCGHDIEFGQFTVIFALITFSMISFY